MKNGDPEQRLCSSFGSSTMVLQNRFSALGGLQEEPEVLVMPEFHPRLKKEIRGIKLQPKNKSKMKEKIKLIDLKENEKTEGSEYSLGLSEEVCNVVGCQTLREFLKSVKFKLKEGLIPYNNLKMKFSAKSNAALPFEIQSLLL